MDLLLSPLVMLTKGAEQAIDFMRKEENLYLQGNFSPLTDEVNGVRCELLEGELPNEIDGFFLRNGPNPKFAPSGLYHWFDGDGMVHCVSLSGGEAVYSNHQIRTKKLEQDIALGGSQLLGIGDMKGKLGLAKIGLFALRSMIDSSLDVSVIDAAEGTANTALVHHNNSVMALVESSFPTELDVTPSGVVSTVGANSYNNKLKHPFTAHPKVCPFTGEMLFFGYSLQTTPYVAYSVVSPKGELLSSIDVGIEKPIMMHDFSCTRNYSIFFDCPLDFKPQNLASGGGAFLFDETGVCRVGVLPRYAKDKSEMKWFPITPCALFHFANAYELHENSAGDNATSSAGNVVVVQGCRFDGIDLDELVQNENCFYQWKIYLDSGRVEETVLSRTSADFPVINPSKSMSQHTFTYLATIDHSRDVASFNGIAKVDTLNKTTITTKFDPNCFGGEFSFIPKQSPASEDDGYLVGFIHNENTNKTELTIFNAIDLGLVCRLGLGGRRVPYGFHGLWVPREKQVSKL